MEGARRRPGIEDFGTLACCYQLPNAHGLTEHKTVKLSLTFTVSILMVPEGSEELLFVFPGTMLGCGAKPKLPALQQGVGRCNQAAGQ